VKDIDKIIEEARADMLPFKSWEQLKGESFTAFAAFCAFRDCGADRTTRKAVECAEKEKAAQKKRYNVFRNWANLYRWKERAADYDRHIENLKQTEIRKTIEARGEKHREVAGKILDTVSKKLDSMKPEDLSQNNVTDWFQAAVKADREAWQAVDGKPETKQGELNFVTDFQGL